MPRRMKDSMCSLVRGKPAIFVLGERVGKEREREREGNGGVVFSPRNVDLPTRPW